jgi:hypothetical protein
MHASITYWRKVAEDLQDVALLDRLTNLDMSKQVMCHHLCRIAMRNRHRSFQKLKANGENECGEKMSASDVAFNETCAYIEQSVSNGLHVFCFSDLREKYSQSLPETASAEVIHRARFNEAICKRFPNATVLSNGRNDFLVFKQGMTSMLSKARKCTDEETVWKAAQVARKDIFQFQGFNFDGSFPADCQAKFVPITVKLLVSMLLYGSYNSETR